MNAPAKTQARVCQRNCVGLSERDRHVYDYDYEKQDYHSQQQRVGA
jgi:hypothetical protein